MKNRNLIQIGGITFFIGLILILISWYYSYPISMLTINEATFYQFSFLLWPGIIFSLIGIFLVGYYSESIKIQAICCAIIPIVLYVTSFFYSFLSASDSGSTRGSFEIFHLVKINSEFNSYYEFPTFFSLNEIIHQITSLDEKSIAFFSFIIYGLLLGLFLFLFFSNLFKQYNNQKIFFLLVVIYFIGVFPFLIYQWVPQTLGLVFFFVLIFISIKLSNKTEIYWIFIFILIFITLVFTHPFIPIFLILFFCFLALKRRYLIYILLTISSIYLIFTLYYTTINFLYYIQTFEGFLQQLGREYLLFISKSIGEPESMISGIISLFNRIVIPIIWILCFIGFFILFIKRKINFISIALGLTGGIYLVIGIFYNVLGLRAAQILLIAIATGFIFFISKWRKPAITFIVIILILSVSGPMRLAYNNTNFQTDEEANACNFLSMDLKNKMNSAIAINQINYGYLINKYRYIGDEYISVIRPGSSEFLDIFSGFLNQNEYIFYNSNLGKEILRFEMKRTQFNNVLDGVMNNNKFYDSGNNYIIRGINPI